jgi:membrane fusion protein, heavy metal efflux system
MKRYSRLIIGVALLLVVIGGIWVMKKDTKKTNEPSEQTQNKATPVQAEHTQENEVIPFDEAQIKRAGVVIARAEPRMMTSTTKLNGEIKFNEDRTAHVVPRLGGIVEKVSADMGQQVSKGQVLAVISSVQLAELRSELLSAQKRRELAQITFAREKKLWEEKISSEQDYLQAKQNLSEMDIALQNATQKLAALGATSINTKELSQFELRAPFDGMVVEKHIAQGEAVKEDANVFTIADLSTVWAEIIVPAQDLGVVRVGESAVIKAASMASTAEGKVTFVGSLLGEQTRSANARVTLKNPDIAWRPGLFVTVDLKNSESEAAVTVLSDAIQTIEEKPTVFVKVDGGFMPQTVAVGRSDGTYSEITKGLTPGTFYAASGSFVIKAEMGKNTASHGH